MKKYVCFLDYDHWSSLNSLWAVISRRNIIPDSVLILSHGVDTGAFSKNAASLISAYGGDAELKVKTVTSPRTAREAINGLLSEGSIILDISGARKEIIAGIFINGINESFDHVFYLSSDVPMDSPYPLLDHVNLCLKDLLED
ncbi:MAG: hypothetical protein R6U17_04305 [Thermoplasmata archaeon]